MKGCTMLGKKTSGGVFGGSFEGPGVDAVECADSVFVVPGLWGEICLGFGAGLDCPREKEEKARHACRVKQSATAWGRGVSHAGGREYLWRPEKQNEACHVNLSLNVGT